MLSFLFSQILSHETKMTFIHLTESTFKRQVLNRPKHQVWMVMFYKSRDSVSNRVVSKFINASSVAEGILKFGMVELNKYPSFVQMYDIKQVPMIRIFHPTGDVVYTGKRDAKGFVNTGVNYIQDISLVADETWIDSFLQTPSAIFFTDDVKIKSIWSSISTYFHGKSIRIGVCRDHDLAEKLGVTEFPSVHFFNGTHSVEYDGKISFPAIQEAIEQFFAKKLENIVVNPMSIMNPSSFTEQCYGGRTNCIVAVDNQVTPEFVGIQKLYAQHKLKWFVGKSNLPHQFMGKMGGYWIYNPRKDGYIHVAKIGELQPALDRIMDGMGKWQKAAAFENKEL